MNDTYHSIPTKCKICHKPIVLKIADCYDAVSDASGIIPMAVCNPCYDLRTRRNQWLEAIERACVALIMIEASNSDKADNAREKLKEVLETATLGYAKVFAEYNKSPRTIWDKETALMFFKAPKRWQALLNGYRTDAKRYFREQATPATTHPDA